MCLSIFIVIVLHSYTQLQLRVCFSSLCLPKASFLLGFVIQMMRRRERHQHHLHGPVGWQSFRVEEAEDDEDDSEKDNVSHLHLLLLRSLITWLIKQSRIIIISWRSYVMWCGSGVKKGLVLFALQTLYSTYLHLYSYSCHHNTNPDKKSHLIPFQASWIEKSSSLNWNLDAKCDYAIMQAQQHKNKTTDWIDEWMKSFFWRSAELEPGSNLRSKSASKSKVMRK